MSNVALAPSPAAQPIFLLRGADFQLTTDQPFVKIGSFTNYLVTDVIAKRVTGGATVACAGGIYTAATKGGNALVAAVQSWLGLSGADKTQVATVAAVALTDLESLTPILSLTTGSTGAITGDVYIFGAALD